MKIINGCVITSVLNTAEKEVNISKPVMIKRPVDTGSKGPLASKTSL